MEEEGDDEGRLMKKMKENPFMPIGMLKIIIE